MKTFAAPEPRVRGHFCPYDFEHAYLAQYDLKDQRQLRRRHQADVLRVRRTHGEPETESVLTGPPVDWEAQLAAVVVKATELREAMQMVVQSGRDKAAGEDR